MEYATHYEFEFDDLSFPNPSNYKFYAYVPKEDKLKLRELYSELISKNQYNSVVNYLESEIGKTSIFGLEGYPSWFYHKVIIKLIPYETQFRISITRQAEIHDYNLKTRMHVTEHKSRTTFVPATNFSFDHVNSVQVTNFIEGQIEPEQIELNHGSVAWGGFGKGIFTKNGITVELEVYDNDWCFHISNELDSNSIEISKRWISSIIDFLLMENAKHDRYKMS